MAQNRSHAVMAQRRAGTTKALDDFPTPPWASRAFLAEVLAPRIGDLSALSAWEPTCNRGYMARAMMEHFGRVWSTDVGDYLWQGQDAIGDFLSPTRCPAPAQPTDVIMFNPPFNRAEEFVARALGLDPQFVVMIARTNFLETLERYRELFRKRPPWLVAHSAERIPMVEGGYDPNATTATAYSWFVWRRDWRGPDYAGTWVPICSDRYKRAGDVNFVMRDGSDWIAKACADTPLFAAKG